MSPRAAPAVAIVAYDRLCTFEFGIAVEVFGLPRPELAVPWYRGAVCSLSSFFSVPASGALQSLPWWLPLPRMPGPPRRMRP